MLSGEAGEDIAQRSFRLVMSRRDQVEERNVVATLHALQFVNDLSFEMFGFSVELCNISRKGNGAAVATYGALVTFVEI